MVPVISFAHNLPALQLVCHLAMMGNITNSFSSVDQSLQYEHRPIPDGYTPCPATGFSFKVFDQSVTPMEARDLCAREGTQLAVLDTSEKIECIKQLVPFNKYLTAGIHSVNGEWTNINTGLPVKPIYWKAGEPSRSAPCLFLTTDHQGLGDWPCSDRERYGCQFETTSNFGVTTV